MGDDVTPQEPPNGWSRWEALVLDKLDSLERGQAETRKELGDVRVEIGVLKVKSGLWGAAAGLIPAVAIILWNLVTGSKKQ